MKTVLPVAIAAALGMAAACSRPAPATDPEWRAGLDLLVATERDFARLATDSSVQFAFLTNMDRETTIFRPGPVYAADWLPAHPFPMDLALEWAPAFADLAADGSLGYTTGPWRSGRRGDNAYDGHGQYLTVWRRGADGFVAALDWGISHSPPNDSAGLSLATMPSAPADYATDPEALGIADEDLDAALEGGSGAWSEYVAENVRWLRNGVEPSFGAGSIPALRESVRFVSSGARSAGTGDFGYSWGEIWSSADSADPIGYYVRIWRTDADHSWKVVVDGAAGG